MKTTKIVDITLCDVCDNECSYLDKCGTCKKEVCSDCRTSFSVHNYGSNGADSPSYDAKYCIQCAAKVVAEIIALGFKERIQFLAAVESINTQTTA